MIFSKIEQKCTYLSTLAKNRCIKVYPPRALKKASVMINKTKASIYFRVCDIAKFFIKIAEILLQWNSTACSARVSPAVIVETSFL